MDLGYVGSAECVVVDIGGLAVSIDNSGKCSTVKECFLADLCTSGYELTSGKGRAVCERSVAKSCRLGHIAVGVSYRLKLDAVLEAAGSDTGQAAVTCNGYERRTVHKYLSFGYTKGGDRRGKVYALKSGTAVEQLIAKSSGSDACGNAYCLKAYAVSEDVRCRKVGNGSGDICIGKSASHIHTLGESGLSLELDHRGERGAVLKEVLSYRGEVSSSVGYGEVGQAATACKRAVTDNGNAFGNVEACKLCTSLECAFANGGYGCGDLNVLKKLRILECVCGDNCDIGGCGKNEGLELRSRKCSAEYLVNAVGKSVGLCGIRCGIIDQSKHILVEQSAVLIDEGGVTLSNAEAGDSRTVGEGVTCHGGKC